MADKKMTRIDALNIALDCVTDADALEVLNKIKASIEKKNSSPRSHKITDAQNWLRNEIIRILTENGGAMSISEIGKCLDMDTAPADAKTSSHAITSNICVMLTNGKNPNPDGLITRSVNGKTPVFSLVQ